MVTKFTIYGERCSGTNYLEQLIIANLEISVTWQYGYKHFFGFSDLKNSDDTLFFGIVRSPVAWLDSFIKNPYHIPQQNKNIKSFLLDKFYSVNDKNEVIKEDLNYTNKQVYKNIYELRFVKNDFLLNIMPKLVKNYVFINYEYIKAEPFDFLEAIRIQFNLKKRNNNYVNISYYKMQKDKKYIERPITLTPAIIFHINRNLNAEQERRLNYNVSNV
jgi:hypothetical protein